MKEFTIAFKMKIISFEPMVNWLKKLRNHYLMLFNFKIVTIRAVVNRFIRLLDLYAIFMALRFSGLVRNRGSELIAHVSRSMCKHTILFAWLRVLVG